MKLNNNDDSHNSGLNLLIYNMLLDIESHPAWVCGLKQRWKEVVQFSSVTPCVGVWIETRHCQTMSERQAVTPCVGVWIETMRFYDIGESPLVTPCVGVWIETLKVKRLLICIQSHPAWVCGLKLHSEYDDVLGISVTPCVGVWIET